MRVIGGEFRSRVLKSVPGISVRPTPDRLREALFNVLAPRIAGSVFADLYAGTGAVGIEALSRGASRVILIEQNRTALGVIRDNVKSLNAEERVVIKQGRASAFADNLPADIVFVDPPYDLESEYETVLQKLGQSASDIVIAQHSKRLDLSERFGGLVRTRVIKQGDNALTLYQRVTD